MSFKLPVLWRRTCSRLGRVHFWGFSCLALCIRTMPVARAAKKLRTKRVIKVFFPRLSLEEEGRRVNNLGVLRTGVEYKGVESQSIRGDLQSAHPSRIPVLIGVGLRCPAITRTNPIRLALPCSGLLGAAWLHYSHHLSMLKRSTFYIAEGVLVESKSFVRTYWYHARTMSLLASYS